MKPSPAPALPVASSSASRQWTRVIVLALAALFLCIAGGVVWSTGKYGLLVVFLFMAGLSLRSPRQLLFLFAFALPFLQGGSRPDLYIVAPVLEVILLVFFVLWFLREARGWMASPGLTWGDLPWLPFFVVATGSALAAGAARLDDLGWPADAFDLSAVLFRHSMLGPLFPARALFSLLEMFLLYQFVRSKLEREDAETLAHALLGSACLVNLFGLVGYFRVDLSGYFHGTNRATSVFSGPNQLATCLLMSLPLSAALVRTARNRLGRGLAAFCLLTGIPLLYFTRSQGAWLAVVAVAGVLVTWLLATGTASRRRRAWLLLAVLGVLGIVMAVYLVATRTPEQLNALSDGRYFLLLAGLEMVRASPLLGVGLGNFYQHLGGFYPNDIAGRAQHEHAHNMYLQVFAELGLMGLVLLLWFYWGILRRAATVAPRHALTTGLLAAVLGVLVHSLTDYTLLIIPTALMFALVLGMLDVLTQPPRAQAADSPGASLR
ncbi:O-antigen ligase family protein [Myxococcus stipitatus]|uniref:O-antigen ligase family protein n=1 Tax=Myxococcus stipitatus TaxID=83455 RepID=UPI001F17DE64|nr:O-antigen ligase family protein [Myxococcus stipitatus]MCE9671225.1 O-antigen ligase family protein [Myxococcus stipitatus]